MSQMQFNMFDAAVALSLVSSGIFAFRRGLLKEVMALGSWAMASVFAFAFYPIAKPFFHEHIKNEMLANATNAIALFSLAIIILVPLGEYLNNLIKSPALSSIDRSLGFVFGVVRGFLVACLFFVALTFIWPEDSGAQPAWLAEAKTKPALAYGVEIVQSLVPEDWEGQAQRSLEASREAAREATENAQHLEDISTPIPTYSLGHGSDPSSYGNESRDNMNELMDRN